MAVVVWGNATTWNRNFFIILLLPRCLTAPSLKRAFRPPGWVAGKLTLFTEGSVPPPSSPFVSY